LVPVREGSRVIRIASGWDAESSSDHLGHGSAASVSQDAGNPAERDPAKRNPGVNRRDIVVSDARSQWWAVLDFGQ